MLHQAAIEVSEVGTEAAAATIVTGPITSTTAPLLPAVSVNVDHPFFFVMADTATDGILFMGRVTEPR